MKNLKKTLLTLACALLLVMASVFGTLAYLVDTDNQVTNTFTFGSVAITLDEADVDDTDNDGDKTERDTENTYKLVPGAALDKDPTVHVSSTSEDAWLFVEVTNGLAAIEETDDATNKPTIETQMLAKGWKKLSTATNIWYKESVVKAGENHVVFDHVYIDDEQTDLSSYANSTIVIKAYAIQTDASFTNAASAWTALNNQLNGD